MACGDTTSASSSPEIGAAEENVASTGSASADAEMDDAKVACGDTSSATATVGAEEQVDTDPYQW